MNLLNKLPGFERSSPGLEWTVLRRLPMVAVAGTAGLIVAALVTALFFEGSDAAAAKFATTVHIVLASALVLHWTVVFTVGLACVIVVIAKGPAYVADAYELIDADRPAR